MQQRTLSFPPFALLTLDGPAANGFASPSPVIPPCSKPISASSGTADMAGNAPNPPTTSILGERAGGGIRFAGLNPPPPLPSPGTSARSVPGIALRRGAASAETLARILGAGEAKASKEGEGDAIFDGGEEMANTGRLCAALRPSGAGIDLPPPPPPPPEFGATVSCPAAALRVMRVAGGLRRGEDGGGEVLGLCLRTGTKGERSIVD